MPSIEGQLASLTDPQVLAILDSLAGEFAEDDMPQGERDQAAALQAAFVQLDLGVAVGGLQDASPAQAASAARSLLVLMAEREPELKESLERWIAAPPQQEAAAIPLVLAAPIVITGCIALLYVVGHMRFRRHRTGGWEVDYDPGRRTPMDDITPKLADSLQRMIRLDASPDAPAGPQT